jgi:YhcH/YjgK/YiaL family protein
MIIDRIENWRHYPFGVPWKRSFDFLETLKPGSEDGKYLIADDDIFAMVSSYKTYSYKDAILESHRKYIDIQTVLSGCEKLEWSPRDELIVESPYNESKDVEFYKHELPRAGEIVLRPGFFVMLFPQDAHMPCLVFNNESETVRKVVIKLKVDLLK